MKIYRVMKVDRNDGKPLVGTRRNMLGVRPTDPANTMRGRRFDVTAANGSDLVPPGTKQGLSVSTTPGGLPITADEALWEIEVTDLVSDFLLIPDNSPHHILEPMRPMTLDEYQAALAATRELWVRVMEGQS